MQFHVYRIARDRLVIDLQSDIPTLPIWVVAPLFPENSDLKALSILEPIIAIEGQRSALHVGELAAVPASILRGDPVADVRAHDYAIRQALDMIFSGVR
ncbi:plasmid maintenance protein CcdB [Paracoccus subflavus]|uniref:Toxin CcdB n=1 Tax=Paracoccus subflavus TaxID=2528244 RepID=A0A4V2JCE5_9RHOB|nr:CcdB family protein [Paracoccus subflavus]TBN41172.1 plasmid maintenance protein CcdB [Paracoccus subflavus]